MSSITLPYRVKFLLMLPPCVYFKDHLSADFADVSIYSNVSWMFNTIQRLIQSLSSRAMNPTQLSLENQLQSSLIPDPSNQPEPIRSRLKRRIVCWEIYRHSSIGWQYCQWITQQADRSKSTGTSSCTRQSAPAHVVNIGSPNWNVFADIAL